MKQVSNQEILEKLKKIENIIVTEKNTSNEAQVNNMQREKMRDLWDNKEDEIWEKA